MNLVRLQCILLFVSECCKLLISSLDQAPFDVQNIPTLFYLVETVLYTIRTDTSRRSHLTAFKSQLLMIGRLAVERIYFHHVAGQLAAYKDLKSNLCNYLDGMSTHYYVDNAFWFCDSVIYLDCLYKIEI